MTTENMKIWDKVKTTDPKHTKQNNVGGRQSTSINTTYMVKKATEAFGPIGIGWGYDILEERFDNTSPLIIGDNILMAGNEPVWSQDHTLKLRLWHSGDKESYVIQYGHTPFRYASKQGKIITDGEYAKKSLSDAMKKCLSLIGVCADIFLGEFDDINYVQQARAESDAKKSVEAGQDNLDKRQALKSKIENNVAMIGSAKSWNEVEGLYFGITNEIDSTAHLYGLDKEQEKEGLNAAYFEAKERLGA